MKRLFRIIIIIRPPCSTAPSSSLVCKGKRFCDTPSFFFSLRCEKPSPHRKAFVHPPFITTHVNDTTAAAYGVPDLSRKIGQRSPLPSNLSDPLHLAKLPGTWCEWGWWWRRRLKWMCRHLGHTIEFYSSPLRNNKAKPSLWSEHIITGSRNPHTCRTDRCVANTTQGWLHHYSLQFQLSHGRMVR